MIHPDALNRKRAFGVVATDGVYQVKHLDSGKAVTIESEGEAVGFCAYCESYRIDPALNDLDAELKYLREHPELVPEDCPACGMG